MAENNRQVCSICLNNFVKPKIIDCHHTYCLHCLEDHAKKSAKNNKFLCPLCRREIVIPKGGVEKFSNNIYIEGVCVKNQVKMDIPTCDVCVNVQSQFRCSGCEQYMCHSCKITHDSLAGCRSNVVFSLDDNADDKIHGRAFCEKHKFAELEFYCRDCETSICMKCLMAKHKDHNTPDLKDFTEKNRKILDQRKERMKGNLTKWKFELETIKCKISSERIQVQDSCEDVDSFVHRTCATLMNLRDQVKTEMVEINQNNVMKLENIKIAKANAIRDLETSISYTGDVLKNQSIEEMLKLSRDMKSIEQVEDADEYFTLPNLQLYTLFHNAKLRQWHRPVSSLATGSVIYFDTHGETSDQKQFYTNTGWETICRFIYYYYLMSFPWIYPIYWIFTCCKVPFYILLRLFAMCWHSRQTHSYDIWGYGRRTEFEMAVDAYNWATQQFDYCICNIFSNTEGFEVNFSKGNVESDMFMCISPDYIRYGCGWYVEVGVICPESWASVNYLQIYRNNCDCCGDLLFGVRIVDACGVNTSATFLCRHGYSRYIWPCNIKLKNLHSDKFTIQIVIFEKDDFIYR